MSHIPATNAPIKLYVPEGRPQDVNVSRVRMKRSRPKRFLKNNPRQYKGATIDDG